MDMEVVKMSDETQKRIFAKNLNKYLTLSNKSQKEVADSLGIKTTTFSMWCTGQALPRMGSVQALADYFGINKSDLIEDKSSYDSSYYINPETREIAQEIYENKDLSLLFDAARDAEPEDLKTVHTMLMALKKKEKGE